MNALGTRKRRLIAAGVCATITAVVLLEIFATNVAHAINDALWVWGSHPLLNLSVVVAMFLANYGLAKRQAMLAERQSKEQACRDDDHNRKIQALMQSFLERDR